MLVRVLAFARVREIIGASEIEQPICSGDTIEVLWNAFVSQNPALGALSSSIRFARNGTIAEAAQLLADGDEVAFLPPVSGG